MSETGIREDVLEEIRSLAQKHHIDKVILFGSRARGIFRKQAILIWLYQAGILTGLHSMWMKKPRHFLNMISSAWIAACRLNCGIP